MSSTFVLLDEHKQEDKGYYRCVSAMEAGYGCVISTMTVIEKVNDVSVSETSVYAPDCYLTEDKDGKWTLVRYERGYRS